MVNFAGAILQDVDFTGSEIDKGLINLKGAQIRNVKGLPASHEANEYLESLKLFSKAINEKFNANNIPKEQLKPIEESIKEFGEEVKDINLDPEKISWIEKKDLKTKFVAVAEKVIKALPRTGETLGVFKPLVPFSKLIGEDSQQIVNTIQKENDPYELYIEVIRNGYGYSFLTKCGSLGTADGHFDSPNGVAVDSSGFVYVADSYNYRIKKIGSSGTFITKWGSLGTADGQFSIPYGVAVDSSGNVYVADSGNNRIQKFNSNGKFITKWGSQGTADGQFDSPNGVAVDSSGNVYVADNIHDDSRRVINNNRIQKFNSNGKFITKWGSYGTADGQFSNPYGVAVDSSGNVYVADSLNNRIQVFSPGRDLPGRIFRKKRLSENLK